MNVEDLNAQSPRPTLFIERSYEAADRELPDDWAQVSRLQALVRVWRAPPHTLELFEPLWMTHFPFWLALAVTHRVRTAGKQTRRVCFAIENNDLRAIVRGGQYVGGLPALATRLVLRRLIPCLVDRIAYGSEAAEALYATVVGPGTETKLFPQVRASRLEQALRKRAESVTFVGALHARKGVPLLLRAWPLVEAEAAGAHLTIVGHGPLADEVARWAAEKPERRSFRGQLERAKVIELLTRTSVIAAPSQPWRHWREQINAAITEALSVGCTVVTTTETGLAAWLEAEGHTVVTPEISPEGLSTRIAAAVRSPLDPAAVLASLPPRDGRVLADMWLHSNAT